MWLALDYFISGATALLATSLGVGAFIGDDEEDEPEMEREKAKRDKANQKLTGLKTVGALGVAGAGYAAHKILESQLKRMRPPFVAFFCKKVGDAVDEGRQLRFEHCSAPMWLKASIIVSLLLSTAALVVAFTR